jgi:hypothetical protein
MFGLSRVGQVYFSVKLTAKGSRKMSGYANLT